MIDLARHGRVGHRRRRLPAGRRGRRRRDGAGGGGRRRRIVLPGLRSAIVPKTPGQRDYLRQIPDQRHRGRDRARRAPARPIWPWPRRSRRCAEAGEAHHPRAAGGRGRRDLGFLPGDLQAKVDPYLRPLYDALEDMMPHERVQRRARDADHRDRAARLHARAARWPTRSSSWTKRRTRPAPR